MDWKGVGRSASAFAGGLAAIRIGMPLESLPAAAGLFPAIRAMAFPLANWQRK